MTSGILSAFAVVIALSNAVLARTYLNSEYGIQAELPATKTVCTVENDGTTSDHGFAILWASSKCPANDDAVGIYIYFGMNAFESRTTVEEGKHICPGATIRPSPFRMSGFQFYQCEPIGTGERVRLEYFVLRHVRGNDPEGEPIYDVSLICPHSGCQVLMPLTRWIFAHMKFIPPDW